MNENPKTKKSLERIDKILAAGLETFLDKGYEGTSLNEVIEKSGGSLSTIYKYFDSKESFFKAVLEENIKNFRKEFNENMKFSQNLNIENYLIKFGEMYLKIMFDPKIIKFHRLMLSEILRTSLTPHGRVFLENGLMGTNEILNDFFLQNLQNFKCENDDYKSLGVYFCFMLREPYFYEAMFFDKKISTSAKFRLNHIKKVVELFLKGHLK